MRGCRFCSTGAMGIVRNLHAEEILATIILSRKEAASRGLPSVDNIGVYMSVCASVSACVCICGRVSVSLFVPVSVSPSSLTSPTSPAPTLRDASVHGDG